MAEYVNVEDLASYPGIVLRSTATNDLTVMLTNGLITDIVGDLDPVPTKVTELAFKVAARALRNPEGYSSITTQIDDWKETKRREGDDQVGGTGVFLSDAEEDYLFGLVGKPPAGGVKSIRMQVPGYGPVC